MICKALLVPLSLCLFGLGGCGGAGVGGAGGSAAFPSFAPPSPPSSFPPAPEPARSPVLATRPTGTLLELGGGHPEGIVADPITHVVVVALRDPARLALIDAGTGAVLRDVPVPGAPRHLQLAGLGGPVIVAGENTDSVSLIALPSGVVTRTVSVLRQPHDAAQAAGGGIVVADELGAAVSLVAGTTSRIIDVGLVQPGGVAAAGQRVAVVDVGNHTVRDYDGRTGQRIGTVSLGDGLTHAVAVGPDRVVVVDTRGGALFVLRLGPDLAVEQRIPLDGAPYGVASDLVRQKLYVSLTARNQLVAFDIGAAGATLSRTGSAVPTVRQPNSLAVDSGTGRVYVAGEADSVLQTLEPAAV